MPTITTSSMIFIGRLANIDVDETDGVYENAAAISGSYSDLEMVDITNHDVNDDGVIWSDEIGSGDYIEYTVDGVTYSSPQDAIVLYNAIITERDGTTHNVEVSVIQAPNGDTFVNDKGNAGATDNLNIKTIELTSPTSNGSAGRNTFASTQNTAVCFGRGTLISTPNGPKQVETLKTGDLVCTLNGNPEVIEWIGVSHFTVSSQQAPITLATSIFGHGLPSQALVLSPQHRVVVQSEIALRMFDTDRVFVSARNLLELDGVSTNLAAELVQYWHILCRTHTVLLANDLPVESMFPGPVAMDALPIAALERVAQISQQSPQAFAQTCHCVPSGRQQRKLIARHIKNNKPCFNSRKGLSLHAGISPLTGKDTFETARLIQ